MKTCFMFGHANTPDVFAQLTQAMEYVYRKLGIRDFVVGSRGDFDRIEAVKGVRYIKGQYHDVTARRLLAYHPALQRSELFDVPKCFDGSYYPCGLEKTPNTYAIRKANEIMVQEADVIICYVAHPGNSRNLLEYAQKQKKMCINLAQQPLQLV